MFLMRLDLPNSPAPTLYGDVTSPRPQKVFDLANLTLPVLIESRYPLREELPIPHKTLEEATKAQNEAVEYIRRKVKSAVLQGKVRHIGFDTISVSPTGDIVFTDVHSSKPGNKPKLRISRHGDVLVYGKSAALGSDEKTDRLNYNTIMLCQELAEKLASQRA
jgi:hypothetical protein